MECKPRLTILLAFAIFAAICCSGCPPPPKALSSGVKAGLQLAGPATQADTAEWMKQMNDWRTSCLSEAQLNGKIYDVPELTWTRTAYFQPLMMPFDLYFYNDTTNETLSARMSTG